MRCRLQYSNRMKWLFVLTLLFCGPAAAETLRVAVASNFVKPLKMMAATFQKSTGHELQIISASTGKLYAQIKQGAPFDVFLAADIKTPSQLHSEGLAGPVVPYALGQLTLVGPPETPDCQQALLSAQHAHLAVANPNTAPYGQAAIEVLAHMGVKKKWQNKTVMGENIAQAFHFYASGNAPLSLVARSHWLEKPVSLKACHWHVPAHFHRPIQQGAVLLKSSKNPQFANSFLSWLVGAEVQAKLTTMGYGAVVDD